MLADLAVGGKSPSYKEHGEEGERRPAVTKGAIDRKPPDREVTSNADHSLGDPVSWLAGGRLELIKLVPGIHHINAIRPGSAWSVVP